MSQGSTRSYGQLFLIFKISDESEDVMLADPENEALHIRTSIYMGLQSGVPMTSIEVDRVFIGSCTNS